MINVYPGQRFESVLTGAPSGMVGTLTFSIVNPETDAVLEAPRTTGISEPVDGTYWTSSTAPETVDEYVVVWTSGGTSAVEGLTVLTALGARPTLEDVSLLLRTRTVGPSIGLGGDTGPGDVTVFGPDTRPSDVEVERMITLASDRVLPRLGGADAIPESRYGQVRHAIALYTCLLIEQSFFREQSTAETRAFWRELIDESLGEVADTVDESGGRFGFGTLTIGTTIPKTSNGDVHDSIMDTPAGS
jgi:hypothetical protein